MGNIILHGNNRVNGHDKIRADAHFFVQTQFFQFTCITKGSCHGHQVAARTVTDCPDFFRVNVIFICMFANIGNRHLNVFQHGGMVVVVVGYPVAECKGTHSNGIEPVLGIKSFVGHTQMMVASSRTDNYGGCFLSVCPLYDRGVENSVPHIHFHSRHIFPEENAFPGREGKKPENHHQGKEVFFHTVRPVKISRYNYTRLKIKLVLMPPKAKLLFIT